MWAAVRANETAYMTAFITLLALAAFFALALRRGRPEQPPLPAGYDGERQLAELRALIVTPSTDEPD
jgi:hypothetical protein